MTSRGANERQHAGANGWRKHGPRGYNDREARIEVRGLRNAGFFGSYGECTAIRTVCRAIPRFFR
jgi:hypothetical protein